MLLSNRSADGSSVAGVIRRAFCAGAPQNTRAGNRANGELPFPAKQMRSGLEYSMAVRKTAATQKSSTAAAKKTPAKTKAGTRAVRKAPAQPADKRVFISNDSFLMTTLTGTATERIIRSTKSSARICRKKTAKRVYSLPYGRPTRKRSTWSVRLTDGTKTSMT